jgi:preprotein translocase subunit Sec61beta
MPKRHRAEQGAMPATGAGLIRYFDEDAKGIKFKPEYLLILCGVIILIELFLQAYGAEIFGP